MTKEEKETIRKNNAKKEAQRERKAQGLVVRPQQLTKDLMKAFTEYLINRFTGEGAHTVYGRFKKMILAALDIDIIAKNPLPRCLYQERLRTVEKGHSQSGRNNKARCYAL